MSYREIRNFIEILRFLGYPHLVSIENFRKPNFSLVVNIIQWLLARYDPSIQIPDNIETEQDRVIFIKNCAHIIASKLFVKLNAKKLYLADGYAVQELFKIANILYDARVSSTMDICDDLTNPEEFCEIKLKIREFKKSRELASKIIHNGAHISYLLDKEIDIRVKRTEALSKQMDVLQVENWLTNEIDKIEREIEKVNFKIQNIASDETNLDNKILKKKQELDNYQKRLDKLRCVRPAFMDEYEKLNQQIISAYDEYVVKFRSLVFLETQWEEIKKANLDKIQARKDKIFRTIERIREEEKYELRRDTVDLGCKINDDNDDDNTNNDNNNENNFMRKMKKLIKQHARKTSGKIRLLGSMESDESSDSDFDFDIDEEESQFDSEDLKEVIIDKDEENQKTDENISENNL